MDNKKRATCFATVLQNEPCYTRPGGKDDALHKQLMGTTTSSLHEKCFCIFGKETSRDKNVV